MGVDSKEREKNMDVHHELGNSESLFSGFESFGSSSSSDFSTLIGSELDSSTTEVESIDEEDDEFMAELTRQMADYMLQEDDDDSEKKNSVNEFDSQNVEVSMENDGKGIIKDTNSSQISSPVKKSNTVVGLQSSPAFPADQMQPIQIYQLENQPRLANGLNLKNERRMKRSESTQTNKQQDQQMKNTLSSNYGQGYPYVGSGMRAVFLGGLGSRNPSSGTGVFLPRSTTTTTPNQPRKKSGCSTVLIPTRVLQALEQHFSKIESSSASGVQSPQHGGRDSKQEKEHSQSQMSREIMDHQLSQLPQEWTY